MRYGMFLLGALASLPMAGQAWDVRVESPWAAAQRLPGTLVQGQGRLEDRGMGQGRGAILSVNHRLVRVNPVLRLDWGVEYSDLRADGRLRVGESGPASRLSQRGLGAGLDAQFWLPFTGIAAELGLIQRFQDYRFTAAGETQRRDLSRTWLRAGARWRLPLEDCAPYLAISYQRPLSCRHPVHREETPDLGSYVRSQGSGQEFERLWTLGLGIQF